MNCRSDRYPLRAIRRNTILPNSQLKVQVLESKTVTLTSGNSKLSTIVPKPASFVKTTQSLPKHQSRRSRSLVEDFQPKEENQKVDAISSETFLGKLLDKDEPVVRSSAKRTKLSSSSNETTITISNVRSLAPTVQQPTLKKQSGPRKKISIEELLAAPIRWVWTYEPSPNIPKDKQEEVAYLALSIVQVVYGVQVENAEVPKKNFRTY